MLREACLQGREAELRETQEEETGSRSSWRQTMQGENRAMNSLMDTRGRTTTDTALAGINEL